jgi:hypothetical protein
MLEYTRGWVDVDCVIGLQSPIRIATFLQLCLLIVRIDEDDVHSVESVTCRLTVL